MSATDSSSAELADEVSAEPLRIQLLGGFTVTIHGKPMRKLRTRQGNRLLALLALRHGRDVDRATVAGRLWMDSPSDTAAAALLRRTLTDLRDALGPEAARVQSVSRFALRLDLSGGGVCDVNEFDRAIDDGTDAGRDRAIDLYRGPLMLDLDAVYDPDGDLRNARDRRHHTFLDCLNRRADARRTARQGGAAADYRRLLNGDPTREAASRALMELLAIDAGDRAGAIAEYLRLRRALSQDLGSKPDRATRALYERIQAGDVGKSVVSPVAVPAPGPTAKVGAVPPTPPPGPITLLFAARAEADGPPVRRETVARVRQIVEVNEGELLAADDGEYRAVFAVPHDAVAAASELQVLSRSDADLSGARLAIHTGVVALRDGRHSGAVVETATDLLNAGNPGQILLSGVTAGLLRGLLPADIQLRNLGAHRFRRDAITEPVFDLSPTGQSRNFPPIRSLTPVPNNLPTLLTRFIGRESALEAIRALLQRNRLVTLTGAGGAGKTRLAQQAAADARDEFPDGVWMVELASVTAPELVAQTAATAIGVPEQPGRSAEAALFDRLSGKRTLLILDNCEHLLQACATFITGILTACPALKVLATSREPIGITGEQSYRVPSLSLPEANQPSGWTAGALSGYESVQFFVDRAALARPEFVLTDDTAPAVARICRRLDGIPLALELAAARTRTLRLDQMVDRLDDSFRLLSVGDRTALPRQRTLRALVDWSYDLLTEREKTLFARLSVFAGGWTEAAAQAVCVFDPIDSHDFEALLSGLVDKSLVLAWSNDARYGMLETLRQYATEKRESGGESAELVRRHRDCFLGLAEEAESHLSGAEQFTWLHRLDLEHDNFRAALSRLPEQLATTGRTETVTDADFEESAHRLAGALARFWIIRGHLVEGRLHVSRILERSGRIEVDAREKLSTSQAAARGKALYAAGHLAHILADYDTARAYLQESLTIRRALADESGIAATINVLGDVSCFQGDYPAALLWHQEALAIYRRLGDLAGIASSLSKFGSVCWYSGDYETARMALEESVSTNRAAGNPHGAGVSLNALSSLALARGDTDTAESLSRESLTINRAVGNRQGIAVCLGNLGNLAIQRGEFDAAKTVHREALTLLHDMGDRQNVASALVCLATVFLGQNEVYRAVAVTSVADALRARIGSPMTPDEVAEQDLELESARARIGDAAFADAWAEGQAMTIDQAVAYALTDIDGNSVAPPVDR